MHPTIVLIAFEYSVHSRPSATRHFISHDPLCIRQIDIVTLRSPFDDISRVSKPAYLLPADQRSPCLVVRRPSCIVWTFDKPPNPRITKVLPGLYVESVEASNASSRCDGDLPVGHAVDTASAVLGTNRVDRPSAPTVVARPRGAHKSVVVLAKCG
jgi:hypothetical protein